MIARLIAAMVLAGVFTLHANEEFTPRLKIGHKAYIDEALQYLLKERPDIKADNLAFAHMYYMYQMMDGTASVCGPEGCKIVPAAPFHESLSVVFTVLDSKRLVQKDDGNFVELDTLAVQFPTPRMPEWHIMKGTSSHRAPEKGK